MIKTKLKKIIITFMIIACLGVLKYIGALPYIVARFVASVYVAASYPTGGFKFHRAEYAYGFGDYSVQYIDKEGRGLGLLMCPKEFPVFIRSDSIKGGG
ncbi:hypothetical protein OXPF_00630 [Oxobacter pfennigii]|uniref:Uncharacterized protein n=1 Tax=Oxobacter pfennigii TaxID=36849 RepID=A0A0P8WEZ1_9CLOT|nr:hypothetical protein [Oxobacter pfennigii]KPU46335.1 hypothetical protein OXPF_00630 [Oxobacter pfennigii]